MASGLFGCTRNCYQWGGIDTNRAVFAANWGFNVTTYYVNSGTAALPKVV